MSDTSNQVNTRITNQDSFALEAENKRLRQENERLARQAEDVVTANAHADELMVKLEEANAILKVEIDKRAKAEEKLRQINSEIEAKVRQRTTELTVTNERLFDEISQREVVEQTLREHKYRLDTILTAILTGVVIIDGETHEIVDLNPYAAEMIGLPKEQIKGKICHKFICPAERGMCPISDLGQTVDQSKRVLLKPTGTQVPILKTVTIAFWQGHEYLVESFLDISELKKAEEHQGQLLEKLENVNRELKDFAYIVSHDLKAPLRGIKVLVEWIATDYADRLDEEGKEQINLLLSRVERMRNLIDGILQYSRIGRDKEEMVVVNLNELIPDIIDILAPPKNIEITIRNELPTIKCEQTRVTQIFQNLLSNAIKYMDKPQGQIKIDCVEEDGFWKFSIADNGPGIEEQYFEKIFRMFQTLSSRDEFESTGVGLTVVKKSVESYGGNIWVESKVGEGSTFVFTLPKQKTQIDDSKAKTCISQEQ